MRLTSLALLIVPVLALSACGSDNDATPAATTTVPGGGAQATAPPTAPPTSPPVGSAAGKPCVAAQASPEGSPAVPVKVGPAPTELVVEDIKPGTGAEVTADSTITVNYIGVSCSTGEVFETSFGSDPATFPLNGVIQGWQEGLVGAKVGGTRLLGIPSDMAYGPNGQGNIAPDETLWFVVDIEDVATS